MKLINTSVDISSKICLVIPVYKEYSKLNEFEIISIKNTHLKLRKLRCFFVGPKSISRNYKTKFPEIEFIPFNKKYFEGINGYNKLLKSIRFYDKFNYFQSMLIVQTDAWIFGNENDIVKFLKFDYCGAPSFQNGKLNGYNGGLSLRNVDKSIKALNNLKNYETKTEIFKRHLNSSGIIKLFIFKWVSILFDIVLRKKINFRFNGFHKGNEDIFWSVEVPKAYPKFKIIDYDSSLSFSWEHNCEEFEKKYSLPFGCHGWWNYNYEFWKEIIEIESEVKN